MDKIDFALLDRFQRKFPLDPRPYAVIGAALGIAECDVIERLARLAADGMVQRVGAVLTPRHVGAGMLVAMAVPRRRLPDVAARVSALPAVNHSYARAHRFNLWFVVTAPDAARVDETVRGAEAIAGVPALRLSLIEAYHLDLGFALGAATGGTAPAREEAAAQPLAPTPCERALLGALQEGLPLVARPYAALARAAGMSERAVYDILGRWLERGTIRRLGIIVDHYRLGYRANAMVVWDVPDREIAAVGRRVAASGLTTLCYRRTRSAPHWPYNLYCMLHGKTRPAVRGQLDQLEAACGLDAYPSQVLFCARKYKQRGARYIEESKDGRDRPRDREPAARRVSGDGVSVPRNRAGLAAL
jgi:siroheme decarboxylase